MRQFNIQEAIEKKRIVPFSDGPKLISKEIRTAKEDLQDAKDVLNLKKFKLATVRAYYAIFHVSRALLYKKRYREKSHIQLAFAIKGFYVDKGLLSQEYYDNFITAREYHVPTLRRGGDESASNSFRNKILRSLQRLMPRACPGMQAFRSPQQS